MNADILLEKGLYSLAKNEIETSINNNLDHSFPIERLLLLRRKVYLIISKTITIQIWKVSMNYFNQGWMQLNN
jgi:hypothetical protein